MPFLVQVSIFAIPPTGQTGSNQNANEASSLPNDSEDGPNPLDFLEVSCRASSTRVRMIDVNRAMRD